MSALDQDPDLKPLASAYRANARDAVSPPALDARVLAAALVHADTVRATRQRRHSRRLWRLSGVLAGTALLAVIAGVLWRPLAPANEATLQPAALESMPAATQSLPVLRDLPLPPAADPERSAP